MRDLLLFLKKCWFWGKEYRFHRSYSQYGEDLLLKGFLGDRWNWNYRGFYVDIGAHDPRNLSNTKKFYDVGWRGINVDASYSVICMFNKKRRRDVNVNVGIGKKSAELDYYVLSSAPMNTFSKEFAEKAIADGKIQLSRVIKVPVVTLCELLDKYLPQGQKIDFMSIDCEGLDFEILESNDWGKYRPDFILIEIHTGGKNWDIPQGPVAKFLEQVGYRLVGQCKVTSLFQRVF